MWRELPSWLNFKLLLFYLISLLMTKLCRRSFSTYNDVSWLPSNAAPRAQNIPIDTNWNWNQKSFWPICRRFSREVFVTDIVETKIGFSLRIIRRVWKYHSALSTVQNLMFSVFFTMSVLIFIEQQEVLLFIGTNKARNNSFQVLDLSVHLN